MAHLTPAWEELGPRQLRWKASARPRAGACACETLSAADGLNGFDGALGDPWLDRLPGVVAGVLLRGSIERRFRERLRGEVHTYAEEQKLKVHVIRPPQQGGGSAPSRGCVVFLHGGGFLGGAPSQFYPYAQMMAQRYGVTAACCEFRTWLSHPRARIPFDSVEDARRCVRFVQEHSEDLGLRPEGPVVLAGASSGGHLAAMAALGGAGERIDEAEPRKPLDLAGLVLFNPVLDLRFTEGWRGRRPLVWLGGWLLRARFGRVALEEGSPVQHARRVPYPVLILHGTDDHLVPFEEAEEFRDRMLRAGSDCRLVSFPGEGHFFFNWRVSPANFARCMGLLGELLTAVGLVEAPAATSAAPSVPSSTTAP